MGLLDVQVLLVAQAQLLSLSRLVEEQRDAAEAANRSKSEFLANISHELRTPLHGILSYARFGLNEAATAEREELHDFFHNVSHCADNLLHLVNDLLDLSKLEAGRMSLDFHVADLSALVEVVIDEFRSLSAEQQVEIRYERPEQAIAAMVDPERIQQVIRNLLSNAVKFSPPSADRSCPAATGGQSGVAQRPRRRTGNPARRAGDGVRQVRPVEQNEVEPGRHRLGIGHLPGDCGRT